MSTHSFQTHVHAAWKLYELGFIVKPHPNAGTMLYHVRRKGTVKNEGVLYTRQALINYAIKKTMDKEREEQCDTDIELETLNMSSNPLTTAFALSNWRMLYS